MTAEPLKMQEPWSWLINQQRPILHDANPLDGSGTPRIVFPVQCKAPVVSLPAGQSPVPATSFPFLLGGTHFQAYHLPTDPRPRHEQDERPLRLLLPGRVL